MNNDKATELIVEECWEHYERAMLAADATERERRIAKQGFLQGARAVYGVVYMALALASTQEEFAGALDALGMELGIDEHRGHLM